MRARLLASLVVLASLSPSLARADEAAPPAVHVELRASEPALSFYFVERGGGRPAFCEDEKWRPECVHHLSKIRALCIAPCSLDLASSVRAFGVVRGDGPFVVVPDTFRLDRDGALEVTYRSRRALRVTGRVLFATLLPLAAGCFVGTAWASSSDLRRALGFTGMGAATVGLTVGFALVTRTDGATARFVPAVPGT